MTRDLFESKTAEIPDGNLSNLRRLGPPNRMNDLPYRDWMKFQKSFFRFTGWQSFVNECVCFFTKEIWPNGDLSKSLILGLPAPSADLIGSRLIEVSEALTLASITADLRRRCDEEQKFDFILVNLATDVVKNGLPSQYEQIFRSLRSLLLNSRYCGLVTEWDASSFPLPWALATDGRRFLKLRDEKIGLMGKRQPLYYCLYFQAENDSVKPEPWSPDETRIGELDSKAFPSWVMPKSPPRKADEINHPAKFPEALVKDFIETFTVPGDTVLDPMAGTGSTLIAALACSRNAIGIDLNPQFATVARERVASENLSLLDEKTSRAEVVEGDARNIKFLLGQQQVDYCITSPPYWSMLANEGSENQRSRRERNLPTVYSNFEADLGNISDYEKFLDALIKIYRGVGEVLKTGGYFTVVVKNIKRNHTVYPLGWDLVRRLACKESEFDFVGNTLWCQDDIGLKPFAVGIYWVSNTLHHYCLHFRRR
jgi:DNA modification methylase